MHSQRAKNAVAIQSLRSLASSITCECLGLVTSAQWFGFIVLRSNCGQVWLIVYLEFYSDVFLS